MITPAGLRSQQLQMQRLRADDTQGARPVQAAAAVDPNSTEARIGTAVKRLVDERFGGNWQRAFDHYAGGAGREVGKRGIERMLDDAGVDLWHGFPPQGAIASRMMDQFDTNRNGGVSWQEFNSGVRRLGINL